ncbi:MAG TPA: cyclase family protein, partial [Thermoanaerobaculia bacterium]
MKKPLVLASFAICAVVALIAARPKPAAPPLWQVYEQTLKRAKYVDLTHTIGPSIPVWAGFGPSSFGPTVNPKTGKAYTYKDDGFEATHYDFA